MAIPWLKILDAAIGVGTIARRVSQGREERGDLAALGPGAGLEARLAGVVVAALKEAFDRDRQRLDAEREQREAERERAERMLRLELLRQAGDREIGRLRLLAGVSIVSWIATLFLVVASIEAATARVIIGAGWMALLAALGAALAGQAQVVRALERAGAGAARIAPDEVSSGTPGAAAGWLIMLGLALVGLGVLLA